MMKHLSINLSTPYPIYIGHQLLETTLLKECCTQLKKRIVIITDSHLFDLLGKKIQKTLQEQGLPAELIAFPAGEIHKTRETKQRVEDELLKKQYGRDTCLIALGGGVVTDLVGFIAATYCRGLPVIYIPTTLLAMVDASIGGKTGVNTPYGKNLLGTFTQPHTVLMDISTLKSLPENEWRNGMVEMIKHSVIADRHIFDMLQNNSEKIKKRDDIFLMEMIYESCVIKKMIVEQDEKEQGIRQVLNFGHTIGHAIEISENYRISHGEAIGIGMLVEGYLSVNEGYLQECDLTTLHEILHVYELSLRTSAFKDKQTFQKILCLDKKSLNRIAHFVLLDKIGKPHRHQHRYTKPLEPIHILHGLDWAAHAFSM